MSYGTIDIRIKRLRTPAKDTVLEALERWAEREGLTTSSALLHLIATHPTMKVFIREIRNPGRETT